MNWQENFTSKILEKGFDYYENGHVLDITKTASGYKAEVEGSGTYAYDVSIEIENDEIKDMDCTCIYGQEIGCCKHMAAVLYAVDEGIEIEEEIDTRDIVNHLSLTQSHELIYSMCNNENVKYKLKLISSKDPCNVLKRRLEHIMRKYTGPADAYEIYDLYSFSEKILEFLEQDIYEVNDQFWQSKVECISYVLDELNELNLDASEEDVWIMFNTCYEMLGTILVNDTHRLHWMKDVLNPIYFREFIETVND